MDKYGASAEGPSIQEATDRRESPEVPDGRHSTSPAADNDQAHSSEEELEVINGREGQLAEKRKWSRTSFGDSSASSDDELRDLVSVPTPVEFHASPPAGAHRPGKASNSPPPKLFHFSSNDFTQLEVCSVSAGSRKRHRQGRSGNVQRPCLDFEKMQQMRTRAVSTWRPSREVSFMC